MDWDAGSSDDVIGTVCIPVAQYLGTKHAGAFTIMKSGSVSKPVKGKTGESQATKHMLIAVRFFRCCYLERASASITLVMTIKAHSSWSTFVSANSDFPHMYLQVLLTLESVMPTLSSPLDAGHEAQRSMRLPATLSLLVGLIFDEVCSTFDQRRTFSANVRSDVAAALGLPPDQVAVLDCRKHEVLGSVIVDLNILPHVDGTAEGSSKDLSSIGKLETKSLLGMHGSMRALPPFEVAESFLKLLQEWWVAGPEAPNSKSRPGVMEKVRAATILSRFGQLEAENAYLLRESALMMARLDEARRLV